MPRGQLLRPSLRADLGIFFRLCLIIYHLLIIKIISTRVIICALLRADWRRNFQKAPEPREQSFGRGERDRLAQSLSPTPEASGSQGVKDATWLWEGLEEPHCILKNLRFLLLSDLTHWLTFWEVPSPLWVLICPAAKWELD